ncbi:MAG: hypothetical protein CMD83_08760 [Gammaproteobacteria bacterium]|nr:hypothetical protein [Gammaproteobacteria bacterium]
MTTARLVAKMTDAASKICRKGRIRHRQITASNMKQNAGPSMPLATRPATLHISSSPLSRTARTTGESLSRAK